jgi:drug/metabolite transporter (DMT)-like permease
VLLGLVLFTAASLQQVGIIYTTVAKSGFITGLYVVLVPLLALFLGGKVPMRAWAGVGLSALGLYYLTLHVAPTAAVADPRSAANLGDGLTLACAGFFALHIVAVGHWASRLPWAPLALTQFATCALASLVVAVATEEIDAGAIAAAVVPVAYAGLLSVGIGYTMQVIAQRQAPATPAAIIMSLETVFAVLGGWWLLAERLGAVQGFGCVLMLAAIVLASTRRQAACGS